MYMIDSFCVFLL